MQILEAVTKEREWLIEDRVEHLLLSAEATFCSCQMAQARVQELVEHSRMLVEVC